MDARSAASSSTSFAPGGRSSIKPGQVGSRRSRNLGTAVGDLKPTFTWNIAVGATLVVNERADPATYAATTNLSAGIMYDWRIKVKGPYGLSAWSAVFSFITQ